MPQDDSPTATVEVDIPQTSNKNDNTSERVRELKQQIASGEYMKKRNIEARAKRIADALIDYDNAGKKER